MTRHKPLPPAQWDSKVLYRRRCSCGWASEGGRSDIANEQLAEHTADCAAPQAVTP